MGGASRAARAVAMVRVQRVVLQAHWTQIEIEMSMQVKMKTRKKTMMKMKMKTSRNLSKSWSRRRTRTDGRSSPGLTLYT